MYLLLKKDLPGIKAGTLLKSFSYLNVKTGVSGYYLESVITGDVLFNWEEAWGSPAGSDFFEGMFSVAEMLCSDKEDGPCFNHDKRKRI